MRAIVSIIGPISERRFRQRALTVSAFVLEKLSQFWESRALDRKMFQELRLLAAALCRFHIEPSAYGRLNSSNEIGIEWDW